MMNIDTEIILTIQQIGGIFMKKNIKAAPICVELLNFDIYPDTENIVVMELLMHLSDLFKDSQRKNKKLHKYFRYLRHFNEILRENSDGPLIISQRRIG